ncbi:MAG: hypothetical protein IT355_12875 [Gemmatimonadaceae bacterium]|nr:hypothetical protein [Gemmatimonadaceae bacterium]
MAPVTLALVNGRIRTGDPRRPVADAIAVDGARLALVGSSAEVRKLAGPAARVVDLRGAMLRAVPPDAVLRRGEVASVTVTAPDARELFRMVNGVIELDVLP